jgi:hypothetical protein
MYYINKETGEKIPLTQDESDAFLDMIDATNGARADDNEVIESSILDYPHLVNAFNVEGFTALHYAIARKNVAAVAYLTKHGASYLAKNNKGTIPLEYIQHVKDPSLKLALCKAVGVGSIANLEAILRREAEAEVLAEKAAEAEQKIAALYRGDLGATDEASKYFASENAKKIDELSETMKGGKKDSNCIVSTMQEPKQQNPESIAAMKPLQSKNEAFVLPVDEAAEKLLAEMFGKSKNSLDDLIGTKESYGLEASNRSFFATFGQWIEYLSDQLSAMLNMEIDEGLVEATILQLQGLLALAGSRHLPMGMPHRYNPDDDFKPESGGGGNSNVVFAAPMESIAPLQLLGISHNGTAIYFQVSNSVDDEGS